MMKRFVFCLVVLFAASQVDAADISKSALAKLGIGSLVKISDADGLQIRGSATASATAIAGATSTATAGASASAASTATASAGATAGATASAGATAVAPASAGATAGAP